MSFKYRAAMALCLLTVPLGVFSALGAGGVTPGPTTPQWVAGTDGGLTHASGNVNIGTGTLIGNGVLAEQAIIGAVTSTTMVCKTASGGADAAVVVNSPGLVVKGTLRSQALCLGDGGCRTDWPTAGETAFPPCSAGYVLTNDDAGPSCTPNVFYANVAGSATDLRWITGSDGGITFNGAGNVTATGAMVAYVFAGTEMYIQTAHVLGSIVGPAGDAGVSIHAPVYVPVLCLGDAGECRSTWPAASAATRPPLCAAGEVLTNDDASYRCVTNAAVAVPSPPRCAAGYVLTNDDASYRCVNTITSATSATSAGYATYLNNVPIGCDAGGFANAIDQQGNLTCATPAYPVTSVTSSRGLVATGTALGLITSCSQEQVLKWYSAGSTWACADIFPVTPGLCAAGQAPQGITASGNASGCTAYLQAALTGVSNGKGLVVSGANVGIKNCATGEVLTYGGGEWTCTALTSSEYHFDFTNDFTFSGASAPYTINTKGLTGSMAVKSPINGCCTVTIVDGLISATSCKDGGC